MGTAAKGRRRRETDECGANTCSDQLPVQNQPCAREVDSRELIAYEDRYRRGRSVDVSPVCWRTDLQDRSRGLGCYKGTAERYSLDVSTE